MEENRETSMQLVPNLKTNSETKKKHMLEDIQSKDTQTSDSLVNLMTENDIGRMDRSLNEGVERNGPVVYPSAAIIVKQEFVYPWRGILANIPSDQKLGEAGSKIWEELVQKGLNPVSVQVMLSAQGCFSEYAIVEFQNGLSGLKDGIGFEKNYEANSHGKADYLKNDRGQGRQGLYGWLAKAEEYNSESIYGGHLQNTGELKTIIDVHEMEGKQKASMQLEDIQYRGTQTSVSLVNLNTEKEKANVIPKCNEERGVMKNTARSEWEKILVKHGKRSQLEEQELIERQVLMEKYETYNAKERQTLNLEKQKPFFLPFFLIVE